MAAQLPPLPSPRSRQTEPPRVGLGRFKKARPVRFRRACRRLSLPATASAGGWARAAPPSHSAPADDRQAQLRSCAAACAVAQREAGNGQWQQRQRGSSGRGAGRGAPAGGARCAVAAASASPAAPPTAGTLPTRHTACQITVSAGHTPTAQHSQAALFAKSETHATHLCGSSPRQGRSGGRARGGSPG